MCILKAVKMQSVFRFIVDALFVNFAYLHNLCTLVELHTNFVLIHLVSKSFIEFYQNVYRRLKWHEYTEFGMYIKNFDYRKSYRFPHCWRIFQAQVIDILTILNVCLQAKYSLSPLVYRLSIKSFEYRRFENVCLQAKYSLRTLVYRLSIKSYEYRRFEVVWYKELKLQKFLQTSRLLAKSWS